jgi:uncharacterized OB-fold protein
MAEVSSKWKTETAANPLGGADDPWADFREIEILELEWSQTYRHSLGKYSKFFLELENQRFFATRCPDCGKVWTPPRPLCPDCLEVTAWQELSGRGEIASFSVLHYAPSLARHLKTPYILAYVRLEGADTLFAHLLQNVERIENVEIGMPVRIVYNSGPVEHPIHLMAFEPD